jgi:hypothetical protein
MVRPSAARLALVLTSEEASSDVPAAVVAQRPEAARASGPYAVVVPRTEAEEAAGSGAEARPPGAVAAVEPLGQPRAAAAEAPA